MKEHLPQEKFTTVGVGESPAELEAQIKALGEKIVRLDQEAEIAAKRGESGSASSLQGEKKELLEKQQELLRERAGLREKSE